MNVQTLPRSNSIQSIHSLAELIPQHLWIHGGVIEVISEQHNADELQLLLPSLARLTHGGRWLAWVASPFRCTSESLEHLNTDPYRLLQIHPGKHSHHLNVVGKALSTGRCCAVMAWSKQHNAQELQQLKQAARKGNAIGVLFSQSGSQSEQTSRADLQIHLQRDTNGVMITLKAPHFIGQKVYHYPSTAVSEDQMTHPIKTTEMPTQLSFF